MKSRIASQNPPMGLKPKEVPMFVTFGFDDNGKSGVHPPNDKGGVSWASKLFHGKTNPGTNAKCTATFYLTSKFADHNIKGNEPSELLKTEWNNLVKHGHEVGNHTHSHSCGLEFEHKDWIREIEKCNRLLTNPAPKNSVDSPSESTGAGIKKSDIFGFRTPFLEFNKNTFKAVKDSGFKYDCSIQEGWQNDHDGTNYNWPYTLCEGSPGYNYLKDENFFTEDLEPVKGLWELPCYPVIIPPDELCEKYGVKPGFRKSKVGIGPDDEPFTDEDGKITGLDYNCFVSFKMNKEEFLATMKYSFDLRYNGNRCPMLFGGHTDFYAPDFDLAPNITPKEMREALEEFIDYVLSHEDARIVSNKEVLDWLENPVKL